MSLNNLSLFKTHHSSLTAFSKFSCVAPIRYHFVSLSHSSLFSVLLSFQCFPLLLRVLVVDASHSVTRAFSTTSAELSLITLHAAPAEEDIWLECEREVFWGFFTVGKNVFRAGYILQKLHTIKRILAILLCIYYVFNASGLGFKNHSYLYFFMTCLGIGKK